MSTLPRTHVASGSFKISRKKREVLEAYLGTCVGLAVVDRDAGIGGLYHILLPEPLAGSPDPDGKIYATTGLPLFLQALREAGGEPARMEAGVAGGALIGSVTRADLQLDIGGRTLELVNGALKEAGIRVTHSETGGYFGAKLKLNLLDLDYEIQPAYFLRPEPAGAPVSRITDESLGHIIANVKPIPQVALKIIRTMQAGDYSLKEIAQDVRRDQVLSANTLKLCNSAYVSPKREIKSVDQALVMLGTKLVGQLVLSSALDSFFRSSYRGYSMSKGGLYHHAVSTAIVAERISRLAGKAEPEIAYTAGLLHDIGKVLLDHHVASVLPLFYRRVLQEGESLSEVEKSLLGITHSEAGVRLAELWDFPESLKDTIAYHGRPELARHDPDLTRVTYLADLLVSRFNTGHELESMDIDGLAANLRELGLSPGDLPGLIAQISWESLDIPA